MRTLTAHTILVTLFAFPILPHNGLWQIRVSDDIEIVQISEHAYVHVSHASLPGFGRFWSNGMICVVDHEALLFDTPVTEALTEKLVKWIEDSLRADIKGFVPNHWHEDCMGGLTYLHRAGIPSYANVMTIAAATANNLPVPQHGFADSLTLHVGSDSVVCRYPGRAHAHDNIVAWFATDSVLFAGCMVKEMASRSLGNLSDADVSEWPATLKRVMAHYPGARVVIPGHGAFGGMELLEHTLDLLRDSTK